MATAIRICQRNETQVRITLDTLEREEVFERGGVGRSIYWSISPSLHRQLSDSEDMEHHRRIERDAAKTRILSILIERARRGEPGLSNSDIRRITHYDRNQVYSLMKELKKEESRIIGPGKGHTATYKYSNNAE